MAIVTRLAAGSGTRAFGGAALDALLRASAMDAPLATRPHSLHAHFLQPVAPQRDVEVRTRVLRASRSFTTIAAEAIQSGVPVAAATTSFYLPRASREHEVNAPTPTWTPEESTAAHGGPLPSEKASVRDPVDLREADPRGTVGLDGRPVQRYWVRWRHPLPSGIDRAAALAWISDLCLTRVADVEHQSEPGDRQAASLDHAMWFHRATDPTDWLIYEVSSPVYVEELALSTGRFFDRDGHLVASVDQGSLLRRR